MNPKCQWKEAVEFRPENYKLGYGVVEKIPPSESVQVKDMGDPECK
jgi:hypothetical protein